MVERQRSRAALKEQVVTTRRSSYQSGSRASGSRVNEAAQNPKRRERGGGTTKPREAKSRLTLRSIAATLPIIGKVVLGLCVLILLVAGYRVIASASFFQPREIDITGTNRTSSEHVRSIVNAAASDGVWQTDLSELRERIEREPWVRTAIISRVLPSCLRVRIEEREPVAVVRTTSGRVRWADREGVLLDDVAPTDDAPAFFMRGWSESNPKENTERIAVYKGMRESWERVGVAERISEVNLEDLRDVRAQLAGRDARIEVRLGAKDYEERLIKALKTLDEKRQVSDTRAVMRLDATVGKWVIMALDPEAARIVNNSSVSVDATKATNKNDSSAALRSTIGAAKATDDKHEARNKAQAVNARVADAKKRIASVKPQSDKRVASIVQKGRNTAKSDKARVAIAARDVRAVERPRRVN